MAKLNLTHRAEIETLFKRFKSMPDYAPGTIDQDYPTGPRIWKQTAPSNPAEGHKLIAQADSLISKAMNEPSGSEAYYICMMTAQQRVKCSIWYYEGQYCWCSI